jgi:spore coat polysaccharide biosynthesis predicted glycosyltransferase SpsG
VPLLALGGSEAIAFARLRGADADEVAAGPAAGTILGIARRAHADAIVTDLANSAVTTGELVSLHEALRGSPVAAFTGENVDLPADVVITPYVAARVPDGGAAGRYLLGPRFFVLRAEVRAATGRARAIAARARHVTIAIGGADPADLMPLAVDGALRAGIDAVRVVIGPAMKAERLRGLASERVEVIMDGSMIEALLWADIAITGDGLLKYECAALGLPALVARSPLTDTALSGLFPQAGTAIRTAASPATAEEIGRMVTALADDRARREQMSAAGRRLVDGAGARRIADALGLV